MARHTRKRITIPEPLADYLVTVASRIDYLVSKVAIGEVQAALAEVANDLRTLGYTGKMTINEVRRRRAGPPQKKKKRPPG